MGEHDTHLGARARQIGTEHDRPRGIVRELLSGGLETVLEKLDVATTAVAALLVLDFVLNNEGLVREADGLGERSRDGMVCRLGFRNEALVAVDEDWLRVFNRPLADVAERLAANRGLLGGLRRRPARGPVVSELLEERRLDLGGLQ